LIFSCVKWFKDVFELVFGYSGAGIAHAYLYLIFGSVSAWFDRLTTLSNIEGLSEVEGLP